MIIKQNELLLYAERKINMEIYDISHAVLDKSWCFPHLRAAFTRIYFPIKGEAAVEIGGAPLVLSPGYIYVIPADLDFSCSCEGMLEKIFVHLNLTLPNGSDALSGVRSCLVLEDHDRTTAEVASLCEQNDIRAAIRLKHLLYEVLDRALTMMEPTLPIVTYTRTTGAALSFVEQHLHAGLCVSDIADALFVSKTVLQRRFKSDIGKSLGRYIDDCLMARAEVLLVDPTLSIKDVSEQLGFCDQFYFSRKFSDTHGISPRVFRRIHGQ